MEQCLARRGSEDPLARPLLDIPRAELRDSPRKQALHFREDATNASMDIQRNRIRHELIPLLTRHYQPALARVILRVMELVGAEAEFVAHARPGMAERRTAPSFDRLPVARATARLHQQLLELELAPDFDLIERLAPGVRVNGLPSALNVPLSGMRAGRSMPQTSWNRRNSTRENRKVSLTGQ